MAPIFSVSAHDRRSIPSSGTEVNHIMLADIFEFRSSIQTRFDAEFSPSILDIFMEDNKSEK